MGVALWQLSITLVLYIFRLQLDSTQINNNVQFPRVFCLHPVRYQCTGSKAAEEPFQSDLHPHRENHGAEPQVMEEQK